MSTRVMERPDGTAPRRIILSRDGSRAWRLDPGGVHVPVDPEYADVDEAGQLALGVAGDQRAIAGLAKPRAYERED